MCGIPPRREPRGDSFDCACLEASGAAAGEQQRRVNCTRELSASKGRESGNHQIPAKSFKIVEAVIGDIMVDTVLFNQPVMACIVPYRSYQPQRRQQPQQMMKRVANPRIASYRKGWLLFLPESLHAMLIDS
jgi:hypothetical protein